MITWLLPPLQDQLAAIMEAKSALEVKLASSEAAQAGVKELMRRSEAWSESQMHELKEAHRLATSRLHAAAQERMLLVEQKESAVVGWHRAQEALATNQAVQYHTCRIKKDR